LKLALPPPSAATAAAARRPAYRAAAAAAAAAATAAAALRYADSVCSDGAEGPAGGSRMLGAINISIRDFVVETYGASPR